MGQILKPWTNIFECDTNHLVLPEAFIRYLGKHWKIFFRATFGAAAIALEITVHPSANLRWSLVLSIGVAYLNSLFPSSDLPVQDTAKDSISIAAGQDNEKLVPTLNENPKQKLLEHLICLKGVCSGQKPQKSVDEIDSSYASAEDEQIDVIQPSRTVQECIELHKAKKLRSYELIELSLRGIVPSHPLEKLLKDHTRAVYIRRSVISRTPSTPNTRAQAPVESSFLPFDNYNFSSVFGCCAENFIRYMPLPVGVAGPILLDDTSTFLPTATTEGTLIESTSRECKAINAAGGVQSVAVADGMMRAPVVRFKNVILAVRAKKFIEVPNGQQILRDAFESTTHWGKLQGVIMRIAGSYLYLRFKASTGEAMGMNIVGKGVQHALTVLIREYGFEHMEFVSLSGLLYRQEAVSYQLDRGRDKSAVAEAIIPAEVVQSILKCSVDSLMKLNTSKNYVGSALAGVPAGGFYAHAANIVTAIFLATGQDAAQNIESSNCIAMMEKTEDECLQISVSMPSVEVGTIRGGTDLAPQAQMLQFLDVKDSERSHGENPTMLARIIAAAVLAGELSQCAALVTNDLIKAHMVLNRKEDAGIRSAIIAVKAEA